MPLTGDEKGVLRALESRIDTVAFVVRQVAERTFTADDRENVPGVQEALADCHHDLQAVQRLG